MKKTFIIACILCAVLSTAAFAAPLAANEAFVILQDLPLWQEQSKALKWLENLAIGDKVVLLNRTAKFKQDGKEREFVKVKAPDGKEGWTRVSYVVPKSSLAVVKADTATVYSEPRDVKVTSKHVSFLTIVAVLAEGGAGGFVKILCFDPVQNAVFLDSTFVSMDDITASEVDVNAAILYTVASASKDPGVKKNLLKVAAAKYGDSIFMPRIQEALNGPTSQAPGKPTVAASGSRVVNDDNVRVRATPDEKTGEVVAKLNKGAVVDIVEITEQTYEIGDLSGHWCRIKDPAGWVFSAFFRPEEE